MMRQVTNTKKEIDNKIFVKRSLPAKIVQLINTIFRAMVKRWKLPGKLIWGRGYYAQGLEDLYLEKIFAGQKTGFYVDVGANDGVFVSNTYRLHKKGWRGICIEPNPDAYALLSRNRAKDICLPVGIGKRSEQKKLYWHPKVTEGSSLDEDSAISQRSCSIDIKPLENVLSEQNCPRKFDLLSIDVEGQEQQVLDSLDWDKHRPRLIIIEYNKEGQANKAPLQYLGEKGYLPLIFNRWNIILSDQWEEDIMLLYKRQNWYSFPRF